MSLAYEDTQEVMKIKRNRITPKSKRMEVQERAFELADYHFVRADGLIAGVVKLLSDASIGVNLDVAISMLQEAKGEKQAGRNVIDQRAVVHRGVKAKTK